MSFSELEKKVIKAIDDNKEKIVEIAQKILENPELGYKEFETSKLIKEEFEKLSLKTCDKLAYTGVKGVIGNEKDFNVCIMGELDSVMCTEHKYANERGEAHACGHNAQLASMMGAAMGIAGSGVMDELKGAVTFMAVPAEEFIDVEYRNKLKEEGKIKYFGGKQQLIYEGAFDDTDVAMMVHAQPDTPDAKVFVHATSLGFVHKTVTFKGKSVHAASPFDGVNALNAASLALLGMHANRETYRDEDKVRVHFIVTKGGVVSNAVPDEVVIDGQVRAKNIPAMKKADANTNRAINGAAMMVGAEAQINSIVGYQPFNQDYNLGELFREVSAEFIGAENIRDDVDMTGSSDVGDLSHLIPTIQPMVGGFEGQLHSKEFKAADEDIAYLLPAKIMAVTAIRLLENDCRLGKKIKDSFKPTMTKQEYLKLLEGE